MRSVALPLALLIGCGKNVAEDPTPPRTHTEKTEVQSESPSSRCQIEITRDAGVLEEQRRLGGRAPDFYVEVPAKVIDSAHDRRSSVVESFTVDGRPILWLAGETREAVVDSTLFSTLTVVDVTGLPAGERAVIGRATELARAMPADQIVEFLIRARIIATYVHIGSTVRCEDAHMSETTFRGRYAGVHTYFTNEEVEQPFAFEVEIAEDGTIAVFGLEAH
jgi:hypothetical protein